MKEVNIPHDVWQASLQRVKRGLVFVEPVLVGSQDELLRGARGLCKRGCGRQQVKSRARPDSEGGLALAPSRCRAQAQRQRQAQSRPALPVSVNAPPGYTTAPDPVKLIQVNHRCPFSRASLVRWGAESCHELLFARGNCRREDFACASYYGASRRRRDAVGPLPPGGRAMPVGGRRVSPGACQARALRQAWRYARARASTPSAAAGRRGLKRGSIANDEAPRMRR